MDSVQPHWEDPPRFYQRRGFVKAGASITLALAVLLLPGALIFAIFGSMANAYSTWETIAIVAMWLLLPGLLVLSAIMSLFCLARPKLRLLIVALGGLAPSALAELSMFFAQG